MSALKNAIVFTCKNLLAGMLMAVGAIIVIHIYGEHTQAYWTNKSLVVRKNQAAYRQLEIDLPVRFKDVYGISDSKIILSNSGAYILVSNPSAINGDTAFKMKKEIAEQASLSINSIYISDYTTQKP